MLIPDGGNYAKSKPDCGPPAPPPPPKGPDNVQDRAQHLVEDSGATRPKQTPAESKQSEAKLGKNVAAEVVRNPEGASKLISEVNRNLPANMQKDVALETATELTKSQKRELAKTPDGRRALEKLGVAINDGKALKIEPGAPGGIGPSLEDVKPAQVREIQSVIQDQAKQDAASVRATYDANSGNPPQAAEKSSAQLDQLIRDDTDADGTYDEKATQDSFYSQQLVEQSKSTINDIGRVVGDNAGGKYADGKADITAVKNTIRNLASVVEKAPGTTDKIAAPISDAMTHDASGKAHDRNELYQVDDAFYNHEDSGGSIKLFRAVETDLRGKGFNTAADELRDRNGDRFSLGGVYRGVQNFELSAIDKAGGISDGIKGLNDGDSYKVSGSLSDSVGAKDVRVGIELSTEIKREGDTYNVTATGKGTVGTKLAQQLGGEEVKVGADGSVKMQFTFTNKEDAIRAARTLGGIEAGTLAVVGSVDAAVKTGQVEVAAVGGAIGAIAIANPSGFRFLNNHLSAIEGGVGVNANVGIGKDAFKDLGIEVKGNAALSGSMRTEYVGGKAVARVWSATAELGISAESKDTQRALGPWGRSTVKATGLGSIEGSQSVTISRREPLNDVKSDQRVEYTVSTTGTLKGKVESSADYNQFVKDNLGATGRMTGKVSSGASVALEKETSYSGQNLKDIGHRFMNDQVFGPVFVGPQDNKVIVKTEVKVFGTSADSLGTEGKGESIGLPDLQFSREKKVKIAG